MSDISRQLISEEDIKFRLGSIFIDSIVLTTDFRIKVVSHNVLQWLEFSAQELFGKKIDYLTHGSGLQGRLQHALLAGYFEGLPDCLFTKGNQPFRVRFSGFYLGLVSDLNDYVILQVQPDPSEEPSADRQGGRTDIDQFIYRASHDLRGPLATMRGLVNLLKLRKDETEIDRLIELIDIHAQKLDDRLFQLFYFSSAQAPVASNGDVVSASQLDGHLRETVSVHGGDRQVTLHPVICRGLNPHLPAQPLTSILDNIVLYLLGASSAQIWVEIEGEVSELRLTLMGEGSITPAKIRRAIRQPSFVYQDLLAYPLLMNYYAAQKSIQYVRGHLTTTFLADDRQRIDITIPRELDANE